MTAIMTNQHNQQKVNQATEQFTDALFQSYKAVADNGVSAQERSAQLTQFYLNQTINNLHAQAEENRQAAQQLADQKLRQGDAAQTLAQESASAYIDLVDSMYGFWQGGTQIAERGAKETEYATRGGREHASD